MTHPASDLPRLERLLRWLTLESWAGLGAAAVLWLPVGLVAGALAAAAVAFTPLLVHALWTLGRRGWLAAFVGLVGGAALATAGLPAEWGVLRGGLVLLAFYSYTWTLKLAVTEWVRAAEEASRWRIEKARWAAAAEAEIAALP